MHYLHALIFLSMCPLAMPVVAQQSASLPLARTAEVFGQKICYYESGQGPAVILLHGTGSSADVWVNTFGAVSKQFHVYAIDQIGFGHSAKPLMDYKIATYVDFLLEFMRVEKIVRAIIVGHSTGGWIGASFAFKHPEMVDSLVLADATGLAPGTPPSPVELNPVDFRYSSLAATRAAFERFFYDKALVTDDLVRRAFQRHLDAGDSYTIQRLLSNRPAEYLGADLRSIKAPTLILWGKQDSAVPVENASRFRAMIPNAHVVIIDHAGHLPQVEKPLLFNQAVLEFLGGNR